MYQLDPPNVDLHWEVPVKLKPTVIENDGKETCCPQYALAVESILLDISAKSVLAKKIGRFFNYDVSNQTSIGTRDKKVKIVCKVYHQNDMKDFHDSYYDKRLHKSLEQYFEEMGILASLDILPASSKKFRLGIDIDRKVFKENPTHHRISLFPAGETDSPKRKDSDTSNISETKRGPGSYPTRQSTNKVERKHRFRIHIPGDLKKIIQVKLCSDCHKEIDGYELKKIPDTNLWEVEVRCSLPESLFIYYYAIECDTSLHIPLMDWKWLKNTKMHITKKIFSVQSRSDLYLAFASQDYKHMEDAYYSHCYYIVKSVIDGQESRSMKEMDEMKKFSFHLTFDQRKHIIQEMMHTVLEEDLMRRGNCMVFVSFLVQLSYPTMDLHTIMSPKFASSVLCQCAMVPKECILHSKEAYLKIFEMIYIATDNDQANLLSFFNCMYPLYDVDTFTKMLSDHKNGTQSVHSIKSLHGDIESAKCILKDFVKRLVLQAEKDENSKRLHFVEKLQRNLHFDLQIVVCEALTLEKEPFHTSLDILHFACERILLAIAKRGDILGVTEEWEKMKRCSFISCEKIQEKFEKCVLESFDKANEHEMKISHAKLKEICINGSLFCDTDTKLKLMRKFASSPCREVHLLVAECLSQRRFQEIPEKDADEIVLSWFECAYKYHCGFSQKRKQMSGFLANLYAYYSKAVSNSWLSTHTKLLEKLKDKTFEYLKEEDIFEIIKAIPEIEKEMSMEETIEDLFIAHFKALLQEGLENGDINKHNLFGQTEDCVVNSRKNKQWI